MFLERYRKHANSFIQLETETETSIAVGGFFFMTVERVSNTSSGTQHSQTGVGQNPGSLVKIQKAFK